MTWLLLIAGGVMFAVGLWGWRNTRRLIPPTFSAESRTNQEGVLQRGAGMLVLTGAVFLLFGLYEVFVG